MCALPAAAGPRPPPSVASARPCASLRLRRPWCASLLRASWLLTLRRHIENSEYDPSEVKVIYRMVRRALLIVCPYPLQRHGPNDAPQTTKMQVQPEISLLMFESGKARRGRA